MASSKTVTIPVTGTDKLVTVDRDIYEDFIKNQGQSGDRKLHLSSYRYPTLSAFGTDIKLHHLVAGKPVRGFGIRHLDDNPFNCTRANLEVGTQRQNIEDRPLPSSGYRGVSADKKNPGRWRVYLSGFTSPEAASRAYQAALKELERPHTSSGIEAWDDAEGDIRFGVI